MEGSSAQKAWKVRPVILCPVWNPKFKGEVEELERVQQRAIKIIRPKPYGLG